MYFIRKYSDCWSVHNDDTGESRKLTEQEVKDVQVEFPSLSDPQVRSVFSDNIDSLNLRTTQVRQHRHKRRRNRYTNI